ncbi:hypothetical protein FB563_3587 [Streptomyces puniciscabiei]|uniref:LPXTG-motif cell wall-anchored protein n=1 Tax=Streptomyces puniciscabiei TaxID=164348 RepID=A0A542UHR1_9ACTN|nr:hypothetical protein [Streptomyces puniciscabiei]TQK98554.1 hypothetical protein FB563_3587 [Streptomyces puniciscabiei]
MCLRPWVAAPLAGAAIALVSSPVAVAAQAPVAYEGDGRHGHHNPWRDCHSRRGVVLIDKGLRAILTNGPRGPEALVIQGSSASSSSPTAPWDTFTVSTYLAVDYPTQTSGQYAFAIREFFRVHPLFEVKAFGVHKRLFPFPATHCRHGRDDGDGGDGVRPQGGAVVDGNGSPSLQKGAPGRTAPSHDSEAAGWSGSLLSVKRIVIAAGGLLVVVGLLAAAWLRRRRSAE